MSKVEDAPPLPRMEGRQHASISCRFCRIAYVGMTSIYGSLFSKAGATIWIEILIPALLAFPLAVAQTWLVVVRNSEFGRDTWTFLAPAVAFLLTSKMRLSYARYWEARGHLGAAIKACRAQAILVRPSLLKHALGRGVYAISYEETARIVHDLRRYMQLYYWLMCCQLLGLSPRCRPVIDLLEGNEQDLLFARDKNMALTALTWISARISHLEVGQVISRSELQEAQRNLHHMVLAFNGTTKIKTCLMPKQFGHLCAFLTVFYVYTSALALATKFKNDALKAKPPKKASFTGIFPKVLFSQVLLGMGFFGIFNLGETYEDPFGDQECDLGEMMVKMGKGLAGDLGHLLPKDAKTARVPELKVSAAGKSLPAMGRHSMIASPRTSAELLSQASADDIADDMDHYGSDIGYDRSGRGSDDTTLARSQTLPPIQTRQIYNKTPSQNGSRPASAQGRGRGGRGGRGGAANGSPKLEHWKPPSRPAAA